MIRKLLKSFLGGQKHSYSSSHAHDRYHKPHFGSRSSSDHHYKSHYGHKHYSKRRKSGGFFSS
ncbi:hypothetical protein [Heyndrickxia acidiproducens]|uniref:hypothetical protein n=1 Tax=Heyndrickxia acidiproducens TaxID=1121084 RepID=UPI00037FE3C3|nr:hypothetical protein [Heyndrickxia acidiproducens]